MLPLEGVAVVSLEQAIAAPFATRQLADLGARAGLRRVLPRTVGRFVLPRSSNLLKPLAAQVQVGRSEGLGHSGEEDEPRPWARLAIRDAAARGFGSEHCRLLVGLGEKPAGCSVCRARR
jgi:hypothetical protein